MELDDPAHGVAAMADRSGASHYFDLVDQSRLNQRDVGSWRGPVDGIVQSHSVYEVENGGAGKAANKWRALTDCGGLDSNRTNAAQGVGENLRDRGEDFVVVDKNGRNGFLDSQILAMGPQYLDIFPG